ncbi:uncharacterized protein [Antedon mediterranea]|uniref:uncharacterized protein n=1 Tax=Antedon mediterranea TaxID=105859 RepID=UPI003AF756B7
MAGSTISLQMLDRCSKPAINKSCVASIKVENDNVQVVCNGAKLYIYEQGKRTATCVLPGDCHCWCTTLLNAMTTLICGLEGGRICAINIKDIINKKLPVKATSESDSTEDIFAGLLDDDETKSSSAEDVLILDEGAVILKITNLVNVLTVGGCLFTASITDDNDIMIKVFQQKNDNSYDNKIHFEHTCERIFKCQRSNDMHQCKMYCVESETIGTSCPLPNMVIIKDELFNEIFSPEHNMMGSNIVLIGLPDGTIVTMPFKDVTTFTNTPASNKKILYNLYQPLAFVCAIRVDETRKKEDNLMLLGTEGKLVTIGLKSNSGENITMFQECYIQEPVLSVVKVSPDMLMYSTGNQLLQVHLKRQTSDQKSLSDMLSSNDLGVNQVVAISDVFHNQSQHDSPLGNVFLLTAKGNIAKLRIPEGIIGAPHSASSAGKEIQELLSAINNLATEMSTMKNNSELHNAILVELNKACHLCSERSSSRKQSFPSNAHLNIDDQGNRKELSILCEITNRSLFTMSCGWSFYVTLNGEHDWFSQSGQRNIMFSESIPLKVFHPGETQRLKFNLTEERINLPIDISMAVHFDASNLVAQLDPKQTRMSKVNLHADSISIPLNDMHFDLLDVLQPLTPQYMGNSFNVAKFFQTNSGTYKANTKNDDWMKKSNPKFQHVGAENVSIVLHFKTFNLCQIIASEGDLNYEKVFRWLLPATHLVPPGVCVNQATMTTESPKGFRVIFMLSMKGEEVSITLKSDQLQVLSHVVMAIHLKMMSCLQQSTSKPFTSDEFETKINNLKEICDEIEILKSRIPEGTSQTHSQQDVNEQMKIYVKARSQLI